jgi:hypothetical protein
LPPSSSFLLFKADSVDGVDVLGGDWKGRAGIPNIFFPDDCAVFAPKPANGTGGGAAAFESAVTAEEAGVGEVVSRNVLGAGAAAGVPPKENPPGAGVEADCAGAGLPNENPVLEIAGAVAVDSPAGAAAGV